MFRKVIFLVILGLAANVLFIACGSRQKTLNVTPAEELLNDNEIITFSYQNDYQGICVENANDFTRQFCDDDSDGLLNIQELKYKTDAFQPDTDGDGYLDGEEIHKAYNPLGFGDLVPEKYQDCTDSSQAWCWGGQAHFRADPSICEQMPDRKYFAKRRADCVEDSQLERDKIDLEMALAHWDYEACFSIEDIGVKEDCQKELAFALGALKADKDFCLQKFGFQKIELDETISLERELQHRCWFAMAVAIENVDECAKLDPHEIKDFDSIACVTKIARLKNDVSICDKLYEMNLERGIEKCLGQADLPSAEK